MTVGGKLRAHRPRRGAAAAAAAEDLLAILEREEEKERQEEEEEEGLGGGRPRGTPDCPPAEKGPACAAKEVAFASLPEKYQPLGWGAEKPAGQEEAAAAERKSKKRKRRLKKYGKNVGKALQKGCRYLVLGLQGLANAYSSPLGVAVSVATMFR